MSKKDSASNKMENMMYKMSYVLLPVHWRAAPHTGACTHTQISVILTIIF